MQADVREQMDEKKILMLDFIQKVRYDKPGLCARAFYHVHG